ncbi:ubiquitin carboxyl-terminal hydrolase [Ceratobasidium sp. AG-Ba]|nr:ubiquitin carboxyl-terminal hydrolase [Ceratobasidium sp. AG-Ba]
MSLSQQLICLSQCAHIMFALFRVDGTSFITAQLYYDIQASIKNIYFCVAKTKVLDPESPFYIIQTGDDRLENRFGIYRTASSDSNGDLLQIAEQSAIAQQVDNILAEYPNYDQTPYRISLDNESGVDHLNPSSWTGDVCVKNVCLRNCWDEGRGMAENALSGASVPFEFDAAVLCASAGGLTIDLMKPFGQYVGVNDSIVNTVTNAPNNPSNVNSSVASDQPLIVESDSSHLGDENSLEQLLPPLGTTENDNEPPPTEGTAKRGWVDFDGRWVRLESATRIITSTKSKEKSTDRLRRVIGYTQYPSNISQSDGILGDLCLIDQIVLALARIGSEISLIAVRVTSIRVGTNSHVESISLDDLNKPNVTIAGQVLELDEQDNSWYWNTHYVPAKATKSTGQTSKPLLVELKASTIELVNPKLAEHQDRLVWSFEFNELMAAIDILWAKSAEEAHNIPIICCEKGLPYHSDQADVRLIHIEASHTVEAMPAQRCGQCYLCGNVVPIKNSMRIHVAKHILTKRLGHADPLLKANVRQVPGH